MTKLIEEIKTIVRNGVWNDEFKPTNSTSKELAELCKKVAIEFAMKLLDGGILTYTTMESQTTRYPAEYRLLQGLLMKEGKELFDQFIENEYEKK